MKDFFNVAQVATSVAVGGIISSLGGMNSLLALLLIVVSCDIATGFLAAVVNKKVCYRKMRDGIAGKLGMFLVIVVSCGVDKVLVDFFGTPKVGGHELYLRVFMMVWFVLAETISLLENCTRLGVPLPRWLKGILIQVRDYASESAYAVVRDLLKKKLHISLKSDCGSDNDTKSGSSKG